MARSWRKEEWEETVKEMEDKMKYHWDLFLKTKYGLDFIKSDKFKKSKKIGGI